MDVDLDHTWVGCHGQQFQTRVAWGGVTFEHQLHTQLFCGAFDGGQQLQVVFQQLQRWHEHIDHAGLGARGFGLGAAGAARVAHFHTQGGTGDPVGRLTTLRHTGEIGRLGLCCRAGIGRAGPQAGGAGRAILAQACGFGCAGHTGLVRHTGAVTQTAGSKSRGPAGINSACAGCAGCTLGWAIGIPRKQGGCGRQGRTRDRWVLSDQIGVVSFTHPGQ